MFAIKHQLSIKATADKVFKMLATAEGLDLWWTLSASGKFALNEIITLNFGPDYIWKAKIEKFEMNKYIHYKMLDAMDDWKDTVIKIEVKASGSNSTLIFHHTMWKEENDHFQGSSYCWAVYLRLIKKYLENGKTVIYDKRLDV